MKKLKFKLDALREEMEILNMDDLISTKGGGAAGYYGYSTWEEFIYAADHGDVPDGSYYEDGVSGGYGVQGDYGSTLPFLHLDGGYGGWSDGGYGGYGGSSDTTAVINYVNTNFASYLANNPNVIIRVSQTPGDSSVTYNTQDKFYKDSNGNTVYGITYKSGNLIFVDISPGVGDEISMGNSDLNIEHELLHAQHIRENGVMYQNNREQFNLNSEYAAYYNQWYDAVQTFGATSQQAIGCQNQMNSLIANGATGGFSTSIN